MKPTPPQLAKVPLKDLYNLGDPPQELLYIQGNQALLTPELREWVSAQRSSVTHFWVIDLRTLAHPIAQGLEKMGDSVGPEPLSLVKQVWGDKLTRIPEEVQLELGFSRETRIQVVLAEDSPQPLGNGKQGYWRHLEFPEYKAGRKEKPRTWGTVTTAAYQAAQELGVPVLQVPYFEADDIIASLVSKRPSSLGSLGIHTVDTDLLQLVEDKAPQVYWYNVQNYHRFRDEQRTLSYWERRHKVTITSPRDIVTQKMVKGDKSDNLPPGSPQGLIDLLYPTQTLETDLSWVYGLPGVPLADLETKNNSYVAPLLIAGWNLQIF